MHEASVAATSSISAHEESHWFLDKQQKQQAWPFHITGRQPGINDAVV